MKIKSLIIYLLVCALGHGQTLKELDELKNNLSKARNYQELEKIVSSDKWLTLPSTHDVQREKNKEKLKIKQAKLDVGNLMIDKLIELSKPVYLNKVTLDQQDLEVLYRLMMRFFSYQDFSNYLFGCYSGNVIIYSLIGKMLKDGGYLEVKEYLEKHPWPNTDWKKTLKAFQKHDDYLIKENDAFHKFLENEMFQIIHIAIDPTLAQYLIDYCLLTAKEIYINSRVITVVYWAMENEYIVTSLLLGWVDFLCSGGSNDQLNPIKIQEVLKDRDYKYAFPQFQRKILSTSAIDDLPKLYKEGDSIRNSLLRRVLGPDFENK
ncbi:MAG: hypothetical protein NZM04_08330 [Methylacidiphilales bacterium]|nr:hypothetical protein [Candidatus Methylacidiphilales bacterium]